MEALPHDVLLEVCARLDTPSVASLAQVSPALRHLGAVARDRHKANVENIRREWKAFVEARRVLPDEYSIADHRRFWAAAGVIAPDDVWEKTSHPYIVRVGDVKFSLHSNASSRTTVCDTHTLEWRLSQAYCCMCVGKGVVSWILARQGPGLNRYWDAPGETAAPQPLPRDVAELVAQDCGDDDWLVAMNTWYRHVKMTRYTNNDNLEHLVKLLDENIRLPPL